MLDTMGLKKVAGGQFWPVEVHGLGCKFLRNPAEFLLIPSFSGFISRKYRFRWTGSAKRKKKRYYLSIS